MNNDEVRNEAKKELIRQLCMLLGLVATLVVMEYHTEHRRHLAKMKLAHKIQTMSAKAARALGSHGITSELAGNAELADGMYTLTYQMMTRVHDAATRWYERERQ